MDFYQIHGYFIAQLSFPFRMYHLICYQILMGIWRASTGEGNTLGYRCAIILSAHKGHTAADPELLRARVGRALGVGLREKMVPCRTTTSLFRHQELFDHLRADVELLVMTIGLETKSHGAEHSRICVVSSYGADNFSRLRVFGYGEGAWLAGWKHRAVVVSVQEVEHHSSGSVWSRWDGRVSARVFLY